MTSRERMIGTIRHKEVDHMPLYSWVFGFKAPKHLRWISQGKEVVYWFTGRMEHIHTLLEPWDVRQDFRRVETWLSLDVDDALDVSIPWDQDNKVSCRDVESPAGTDSSVYPLLVREYHTPDGLLRHVVRRTNEQQGPGWVVQPNHVPLFEDFNISRGIEHLVRKPEDVRKIKWLYKGPSVSQTIHFAEKMACIKEFADEQGVMIQAWSAFGIDAVVWLAGVEGAVMLCLEHPDVFADLLSIIYETDKARTILALQHNVDMVVQRGWYSSTDFWSPVIFKQYFKPKITELAATVHAQGKLFGYVMTTGVMTLGSELIDAGVDLLYYVDPVQDHVDLGEAKKIFGSRMALAGGVNSSVTLFGGNKENIRAAVDKVFDVFGNGSGFILSPVDALFPDTPWESVETMIEAWRECTKA